MPKHQPSYKKSKDFIGKEDLSKRHHRTENHEHDIYGEDSLWECENLKSGVIHHINGALAQVLKHYPEDYTLTFITPFTPEGA